MQAKDDLHTLLEGWVQRMMDFGEDILVQCGRHFQNSLKQRSSCIRHTTGLHPQNTPPKKESTPVLHPRVDRSSVDTGLESGPWQLRLRGGTGCVLWYREEPPGADGGCWVCL